MGIVACTATLSINGCYFLTGITNSSADGVVAFYPTARLHYKELFHVVTELLIEVQAQTSCIITGIVCKYYLYGFVVPLQRRMQPKTLIVGVV